MQWSLNSQNIVHLLENLSAKSTVNQDLIIIHSKKPHEIQHTWKSSNKPRQDCQDTFYRSKSEIIPSEAKYHELMNKRISKQKILS